MINKILRSKYKLYHLINVLYYGVFFVIGYLLGYGIKLFN